MQNQSPKYIHIKIGSMVLSTLDSYGLTGGSINLGNLDRSELVVSYGYNANTLSDRCDIT